MRKILFILSLQFFLIFVPYSYANNIDTSNNQENKEETENNENIEQEQEQEEEQEEEKEEEEKELTETEKKLIALFSSVYDKYSCNNPSDIVKFPEGTRLEACVRTYTTANRWPIRCSYAAEITHIECNDPEITSLDGLQQFPNLKSLKISLNGSKIEDLSPIRNLTKLEVLSIPYSNISEIGFLAKMQKLRSLDLKGNKVTNLEFIYTLQNLEVLSLEYQGPDYINDITYLGTLYKLRVLSLQGNKITNILALSNLKNLTYLNISDNRISDLTPLQELENITAINFNINMISSLEPLRNMKVLNSIKGDNNNISDLTPLENLTQLTELRLQINNISNITPLTNLVYIKNLNLDYNNVTDIMPLSEVIFQLRLKELGLSYNCVPEDIHKKIRFFSYIPNVRLDHQCEDFPTDVFPDSQLVVNADLVNAKNTLSDQDITLTKFESTAGGGCSIIPYGSKPIFDIIPILFIVAIIIRNRMKN